MPRLAVHDIGVGEVVQFPGVPDAWVHFPLTALLSLVASDASGTGVAVAMVGSEGATGLTSTLTGFRPPFQVVGTIAGRVARLPADEVAGLIASEPRFHDAVLRCLGAQVVEVVQVSACNRLHPLSDRVARWLLCMADRTGQNELPATHELLAEMLGASRPNVSSALESFVRRGLVDTERGVITILDRDGLAAAGDGCHLVVADALRRLRGRDPRAATGGSRRGAAPAS